VPCRDTGSGRYDTGYAELRAIRGSPEDQDKDAKARGCRKEPSHGRDCRLTAVKAKILFPVNREEAMKLSQNSTNLPYLPLHRHVG